MIRTGDSRPSLNGAIYTEFMKCCKVLAVSPRTVLTWLILEATEVMKNAPHVSSDWHMYNEAVEEGQDTWVSVLDEPEIQKLRNVIDIKKIIQMYEERGF